MILISGVSCTGKTLMSQKLMEKHKIPYFSIDHLKMGLYKSDPHCGFSPTDSNEVIGEKLWPIVRAMIVTVIENGQNIIIEGCYLLPHLVKELERACPDQIISVFLGFSTDYIQSNFVSNILGHRSAIERRDLPEERPIAQFIGEHDHFRNECRKYRVNYFMIEDDYEEEIKLVYDFVDDEVSRKRESGMVGSEKQSAITLEYDEIHESDQVCVTATLQEQIEQLRMML